jgi:GNAT superfamily N-acetyltransferase
MTTDGTKDRIPWTEQQEILDAYTHDDDESDELYDWQAMIPSLVAKLGFTCTEQTMESAQMLLDAGLLGNFTQTNANGMLSPEIEASLLESFVEDDYQGTLHLTTLDNNNDQGHPVGFVFWRQVPEEEMEDWIHWENLQKKLIDEQQQQQQQQDQQEGKSIMEKDHSDLSTPVPTQQQTNRRRRMRQSIRLVQDESIRWLEVAASESSQRRASTTSLQTKKSATSANNNLVETLTHSWVKIELLAVHPDYWNQHLGTLLLACAMYQAYQKGEDHMILHVAGGQENVPALKLYHRFGFLPVPHDHHQGSTGNVFRKPNKDLFLLGHVGKSLQRFCWPALLEV